MVSTEDFFNIYSLIVCVSCLFWYYSISTFDYWKKRNVKFKKPIPLFGNTFAFTFMLEPLHTMMHKIYTYFGDEPYGGMYRLRTPLLFVKDPELINDILVKNFKHFCVGDLQGILNINKDLNPLNEHIFTVKGARWRFLRHKMIPIFTAAKLKGMHESIYECVSAGEQCIANKLADNSAEVNVTALSQGISMDVTGSCSFGITCNAASSESSKFRETASQAFKLTIRNATRLAISMINPKILNLLRFADYKKEIQDFYFSTVLNAISYRRRRSEVRNDFLQLLMNLQNAHRDQKYAVTDGRETVSKNEEFSEVDIVAHAFVLFVASFGTTGSTLNYCLYELAINPEIQNKVRQETERVLHEHPKQTPEGLKQLTYMDMVIKETLRKYPPAPLLYRKCTEDYILPKTGTLIRTGTSVGISIWSIHHDPKYYPNPEIFDPDRFSPENIESRPKGTFIPFSDGPRICLGKRFAELVMKSALAELILKYDFSPCSKTEIPLTYKPSIFLEPKNDILIRFTKRKT